MLWVMAQAADFSLPPTAQESLGDLRFARSPAIPAARQRSTAALVASQTKARF